MCDRNSFHGSNSSEQSELLSLVQNVVKACTTKRVEEQRKFTECLKRSLIGIAKPTETFLCHISKKHFSNGDSVRNLLLAVEMCNEDSCLLLLCRFIQDLISVGSVRARLKRHRRLIKVDATSALLRALRCRLKEVIPRKNGNSAFKEDDLILAEQSDDTLADLVLAVGAKDCRLSFKIRVSGVLQLLCSVMASDSANSMSITMAKLLCRSVRSPRNAQLAGRHRGFAVQLLVRISSLKGRDPVQSALLARFLEMLYFITKNRKTRVLVVGNDVVGCIVPLFERHFWWMKEDSYQCSPGTATALHAEICLICLALLRLLSSNKRAKEQLLSYNVLTLCQRIMIELDKDLYPSAQVTHLEGSICSLCLRCLPQIRFPDLSSTFLKFGFPSATRRSSSKSDVKRSSGMSQASTSEHSLEIYVEESSDDDGVYEEDELFWKFGEDHGSLVHEVDDEVQIFKDVVHSRLKTSELESYSCYFTEYEHGTEPKRCEDFVSYSELFQKSVQSTRSVISFVKVAFPELQNPDVDLTRQPHCSSGTSMREVVLHEVGRAQSSVNFPSRVVFDLDSFVSNANVCTPSSELLTCNDHARVGHLDPNYDHLLFESRFESGNLRRATQIGPHYYELILSPDINQRMEHYQWFYFEVSNIVSDVIYTFEIVNCLKTTSMFSKGMQPVMYSVQDALAGKAGWVRAGDSVCYYRNLYTSGDCFEMDESAAKKHGFYSIRFNVTFRNKGDVCYFAYHFPYTFSYLKTTISRCLARIPDGLYYSNDIIGTSLGGNHIHLLTITTACSTSDVAKKDFIFLSSRVHPGESNSSWMMHGILETLLMSSDHLIEELRRRYVFKIVPILNPDGVINGSHRCSLSGEDLNRVWDKPSRTIHPEIYHTKAIIQYMCDVLKRPPFVFVDLHGHSRRANVFMFGNNPEESWRADDKTLPHNYDFMKLPEVLEKDCAAFSFNLCQFGITRGKESSARVTIWRQFGVSKAYTMESTFFGFETGAFKGYQIGTKDLKDIGRELLLGILKVSKLNHHSRRKTGSGPKKGFSAERSNVSKAI